VFHDLQPHPLVFPRLGFESGSIVSDRKPGSVFRFGEQDHNPAGMAMLDSIPDGFLRDAKQVAQFRCDS